MHDKSKTWYRSFTLKMACKCKRNLGVLGIQKKYFWVHFNLHASTFEPSLHPHPGSQPDDHPITVIYFSNIFQCPSMHNFTVAGEAKLYRVINVYLRGQFRDKPGVFTDQI